IASARAPPPPTAPIGQFVPDPRLRENITVQQWLKKPPYLEGAVLGLLETPAQYQRLHAGPGDFLLFLRPATSEHIACDEAAVAGFYEDRGRGLGGGTCGAAGRPGATRL
ncbi:MAG TPA: hypothetical protein VKY74_28150, partial [Chloroflexia bacterium]|nr:hypothetical protein [Chloroflexia bacterium]